MVEKYNLVVKVDRGAKEVSVDASRKVPRWVAVCVEEAIKEML